LANATAASLGGLRLRRSMSQGDARPLQPTACLITAVAPDTSTARKASSPARVMTPSLTLPAVEWSLGVNPIQAANWRPDRNSSGAGVLPLQGSSLSSPELKLYTHGLYRLAPTLNPLAIAKQETVIKWQHAGFRSYWSSRPANRTAGQSNGHH